MKKTRLAAFVQQPNSRLWTRTANYEFGYSDGDETESRILDAVQQAKNVSTFSQELISAITDWPSEYHFSPRRANIIRPLNLGPGKRVLELGCGCGAITRAIVEQGASVDAIEGSPRRAAVAAERVRDQENARIYVANFQDVEFEPVYDFVTLIGVLEYAPAYIDSPDPFLTCLEMARSALKPGGTLVVAIENKLGLKYFAGLTEDHFAIAYYGIEGRYCARQVTTYGKRQLSNFIRQAGFGDIAFLYPFPDYKLPEVIISEAAIAHPGFNAACLISGLRSRDYSEKGNEQFRLDLAWESVASEGLLGELANSFLITARQTAEAHSDEPSILAQKYSDSRKPAFNTVTTFAENDGHIVVDRTPLTPPHPGSVESNQLIRHALEEEDYVHGTTAYAMMRRAALCKDEEAFQEALHKWADFLRHADETGELDEKWIDAVPSNVVIDSASQAHYIDREWKANFSFQWDLPLHRGFIAILRDSDIHAWIPGETDADKVAHLHRVVNAVFGEDSLERARDTDLILWEQIYDNGAWQASIESEEDRKAREEEAASAPPKGDRADNAQVRAIAFHLPQYHRIPENDRWWGEGFTEWDNVRQGKPLFEGHYQPHTPGELGYYDLTDVSILKKQARLARQHGIEGFCFYYYWFDGHRLLEKPVDTLLVHPEIDLPFCLCWANENWTRRWDGGDKEVLIEQTYTPESHERFARDLAPYFKDRRYITVHGKPVVLIYRADIIPNLIDTVQAWRRVWRDGGVGEVYLICVESFTTRIPNDYGFDAACEFFPHQVDFSALAPDDPVGPVSAPQTTVADYNKLADKLENRPAPPYKRFRGIVPSWDNSSRRRKGGAYVFANASPARYEQWLTHAAQRTLIEQDGAERMMFINAWNEWGEGCHLEPDAKFGRGWLEATSRALANAQHVDVHFHRYVAPYQSWLAAQTISDAEAATLIKALGDGIAKFFVIVDAIGAPAESLANTLRSLSDQPYPHIQVIVVSEIPSPSEPGNSVLWLEAETFPDVLYPEFAKSSPDSWFVHLHAGDQIWANTLQAAAQLLATRSEVGMLYCDEDVLHPQYGATEPVFRPDFDIDYLRSFPYLGRFLLLRGRELSELQGLDPAFGPMRFHDYALRYFERYSAAAVAHLPIIGFHGLPLQSDATALQQQAGAVDAHLRRLGKAADISSGLYAGSLRVLYQHTDDPLISILVPTKDNLALLQRCLESLLEKTSYTHYEVIIIDNGSQEPDARKYLQGLRDLAADNIRVLDYPHPFNFSAMNNAAASQARGEYLVLLNNDTAIVQDSWLQNLLNHALRPEVGVTGAKLLFPNGTVQHAGVILGLRGPADHPFVGESMNSPGYYGRLLVDQQYSAVTAACLMIRKSLYVEVGGMDENDFKVSYNDVDLCLKTRRAGYEVVWTPYCIVMHEGGATQNTSAPVSPEKRARFLSEQHAMYRNWMPLLSADPAYNPNLSLDARGFELETDPLFAGKLLRSAPFVLTHNADTAGSGRYRVLEPLRALCDAGLSDGAARDYFLDPVHVWKLRPDVIVLQRQYTDKQLGHIEDYRRFSGARLIYDLDDNLLSASAAGLQKGTVPKDIERRLHKALADCDRLCVSTEALKTSLKGLHSDTIVLPNYLPLSWWNEILACQRGEPSPRPRIGWAGGSSHSMDLRILAEVVPALSDRVDWVFLGMAPEGLERHIAEIHTGVPIDRYPAYLASLNLDLALAPLQSNKFNECKSNLRLLEYGACAYPVIASDIEPYRGTLPVTLVKNRAKDWIAAIEERLADRTALLAEGNALRAVVRAQWMLDGENLARWQRGWMLDLPHH